VLLGDSEMAEGSVWEAIQIATHYKLDNLIGIIDVNRLGQSNQALYGHDIKAIAKRISAFGWHVISIDGHSFKEIKSAFKKAQEVKDAPVMIVAKTFKGRGISFLENKENWHGKALNKDELQAALSELGKINKKIKGELEKPKNVKITKQKAEPIKPLSYQMGEQISTRKAYGNALVKTFSKYPDMVVLDAEVSNSTFSETFKKAYPERFFEMFIAEQNMVGVAMGLSKRGKIPFVSTFAAFLSRAFDQIRMSQYSDGNIKFVGSHAGVSIGEDGASQMGLEDIAMFRTLLDSVVLYPSDAVSTEKLVEKAASHKGNVYIRTTRGATPVLYKNDEDFPIGGSKLLRSSKKDVVTIVAAGITLHEALTAYEKLKKENVLVRVIDLYSIKPLDVKTLKKAAAETKAIITVEDHFEAGGIGEAVKNALSESQAKVYSLAVRKMPKSGKPEELLDFEEISSTAIVKKVKAIL
jgi:transketolase